MKRWTDEPHGMYGPYRKITAVGEHESTGTLVTLDCGHTWTLVPHMHIDQRSIGELHQCTTCRKEQDGE